MAPIEPTFFADRSEWRKWLSKNHDKESEIWILAYKIHTGKCGLTYSDALDEALSYGWIDSRLRRIDEEKHMWRFAPRKPGSIWSLSNRTRAERLIKEGRMTQHGLASVANARRSGQWDKAIAPSTPPRIPANLRIALRRDEAAWKNFQNLAKSYRTQYIYWIISAKRTETREKRIREVVARVRMNKKMYPP